MQARPILYTLLIALGFALLANSWVVQDSEHKEAQKSSLSGLHPALALPKLKPEQDTVALNAPSLPPVEYDTSDVSASIQDLVLVARIKKQLFKKEDLRDEQVTIKAENGRVKLEGRVASQESKQLIESTVKRIKGVSAIDSELIFLPGS